MTEKRYRVTIFTNIWVEDTGDDEFDLAKAKHIAKEFASLRPNTEVAQVIEWGKMLDEEVFKREATR